jgi:integrase
MLSWKTLNSLIHNNGCKGRILSARIYADVPGNKCLCGGKFSKRVPYDEDEPTKVPRCDKCNKLPPLFRIDADAKDANGKSIRVWIRNTSERTPQRLDKIAKVITTIETIQREMTEGTFDIRNYDSEASKQQFVLRNYVEKMYLPGYEEKIKSGEVQAKYIDDKKSLLRLHILPYFGNLELRNITAPLINAHKKKFNTRRIHHQARAELKCCLNQAVQDGMLTVAPPFEKIPKAETRQDIITNDLIDKTINALKSKVYQDICRIMTMYPLRPSEVRALRWIDISETHLHVRGHFSKEVWVKGRKSIKEGKKSELRYKMEPEAWDIFKEYKSNLSKITRIDDYVFKAVNGRHVTKYALCHAWRVAREDVGHKHQLYDIRHRCLTDHSVRHNGNIVKMMKFSGHTTPTVLLNRYIHDDSDPEN